GLDERRGISEPRGDVRRQLEGRAGLAGVARAERRPAQREQEPESPPLVGREGLEQQEGALEVAGRLLVSERRVRTVARELGVVDRLRGIAERKRPGEVIRELAERTLAASLADCLEGERDAPVELDAQRRSQIVVERLTDQGVRETKAAEGGGNLREQI